MVNRISCCKLSQNKGQFPYPGLYPYPIILEALSKRNSMKLTPQARLRISRRLILRPLHRWNVQRRWLRQKLIHQIRLIPSLQLNVTPRPLLPPSILLQPLDPINHTTNTRKHPPQQSPPLCNDPPIRLPIAQPLDVASQRPDNEPVDRHCGAREKDADAHGHEAQGCEGAGDGLRFEGFGCEQPVDEEEEDGAG